MQFQDDITQHWESRTIRPDIDLFYMSYVQKKWNSKNKMALVRYNARIVLKAVAFPYRVWFSVPSLHFSHVSCFPSKEKTMLKQVDKYYICFPGTNESK